MYQLSPTGIGEPNPACVGQSFNITVVTPATGEVSFSSQSPVQLTPPGTTNSVCRIDFTVNVLKAPSVDAKPGTPGVQTDQIGSDHGTNTTTLSQGFGDVLGISFTT